MRARILLYVMLAFALGCGACSEESQVEPKPREESQATRKEAKNTSADWETESLKDVKASLKGKTVVGQVLSSMELKSNEDWISWRAPFSIHLEGPSVQIKLNAGPPIPDLSERMMGSSMGAKSKVVREEKSNGEFVLTAIEEAGQFVHVQRLVPYGDKHLRVEVMQRKSDRIADIDGAVRAFKKIASSFGIEEE